MIQDGFPQTEVYQVTLTNEMPYLKKDLLKVEAKKFRHKGGSAKMDFRDHEIEMEHAARSEYELEGRMIELKKKVLNNIEIAIAQTHQMFGKHPKSTSAQRLLHSLKRVKEMVQNG